MILPDAADPIAVWALTPGGIALAGRIARLRPDATLFLPEGAEAPDAPSVRRFTGLRPAVAEAFSQYRGHVFVMAVGIAVRITAPLLRHKTVDPAVVAADDTGRWAVSLVSGHLGGANRLAEEIAAAISAEPVITTATDAHGLLSIDLAAAEEDLAIANPEAIKTVNMAILRGEPVTCFDPYGCFGRLRAFPGCRVVDRWPLETEGQVAAVMVTDHRMEPAPGVLVLHPRILFAGIGCNRGTTAEEIRTLIQTAMEQAGLAMASLAGLASIDLKADEAGLQEAAAALGLSLRFYRRDQLEPINDVPNPSETVRRHVGVSSVCEAAAILAAGRGPLILPKHRSTNATIAVARIVSLS
jgi:cobalt-precorrin 5A hydrolase